ncbi:MAG: hypothetical protein HON72_05880 [Porticoccaceae bacterium]|jgi:hypothetical protein|nr:hypothetical protein [Porticoccaceae bacterium]
MAVIKSNRAKIVAGLILGATMLASSSFASGNDLAIPHEFFSGDATSAIHVNENFSAIEVAVNGIGSRIKMLESDTAKPVFQGFSDTQVPANKGVRQLQAACDATYSGSKICTSTEYANSIFNNSAANLAGDAWLLADTQSASEQKVRDSVSGRTRGSGGLSCAGYSRNKHGLVVSGNGEINTDQCGNFNAVACCK